VHELTITLSCACTAGLSAVGNGAFTTQAFTVPTEYLWLNMDNRPGGGAAPAHAGHGKDGRVAQSYIMVALLFAPSDVDDSRELTGNKDSAAAGTDADAISVEPIPGFEASRCVMPQASEQGMPLTWKQDNGTAIGAQQLAGRRVRARILLGLGATVYSLGAGSTWENQISWP